jgi:RNA polymerase sigma-70 factor (ECF subfamily)
MNNTEIFENIYTKHYDLLLNYAKRYVNDSYAEDVLHNVFFKIETNSDCLADIASVQDNPKHAKAILFRCVHNECIDFIRHDKVTNKIFVDMPDSEIKIDVNPEQQYQNNNILDLVMVDINKLDDPNRTIFITHRIKGYSIKELAKEFQLSPSAIESRIYRVSNIIKDKWKKMMNDG